MVEKEPLMLSLCMIVKNEAKHLPRCLDSIYHLVDEIIVVDTGSTDETMDIAQRYGARLLHHQWQDDFSLARNVGLDVAQGQWIVYIDGDEALDQESAPHFRSTLENCTEDAIMVNVRSFNPEGSLAPHYDSPQVRIFRNRREYRFEQRVHNQIIQSIQRNGGVVAESELQILHYGYLTRTVQGGDDRYDRSLRILEKAVSEEPQSAYLNAKLGFVYYEMGNFNLAYAYLRRVIVDLDARVLQVDMFHQVLAVFGDLCLQRGELDLAQRCGQAALGLNNAQPALSFFSRKTLAKVEMQLAAKSISHSNKPGTRNGKKISQHRLKTRQSAILEGKAHLRKALEQLETLLSAEQITPEGEREVRELVAECQRMLTEENQPL